MSPTPSNPKNLPPSAGGGNSIQALKRTILYGILGALVLWASLAAPVRAQRDSLDFREPRSFYIKTNLLGLALLNANLAVEFEIGRHVSLSLPFYYSAWDWFVPQSKFRGMGAQPELRVWPCEGFRGPFVAVHGTVGWYNVALPNAEFRYQDRDGRTPAYGAGLIFGWKFRLDSRHRNRWGLVLSFGGGWLHLDSDVFSSQKNGRYIASEVYEHYGITQASVALTYRFGR